MINYRDQALEVIARRVIKEYDPALLTNPVAIPIEDIMEQQYGLILNYQYIRNNGRILGETTFDDMPVAVYDKEEGGYTWVIAKAGTVFLDASLLAPRNIGRLRFTEAHELAHWLIHREIYEGSGNTAAMLKNNPASSSGEDVLIERQADRLACFLLMPGGQVKMAFNHVRNSADPVAEVAGTFGVSRQAMSIRLSELHLI
jgi:hypothetical protein